MKQVSVTLWELTKEEAQKLKEATPVLIYNTLSCNYTIELANKNSVFFKKNCPAYDVFFTMKEPEFSQEALDELLQ